MFKKPFKTKSNCQVKSSEKKKLLQRIKAGLPSLSEDHELFNNKDPMNVLKVTTYSGANVNVYVQASTPIFFEVEDAVYPTAYTLWKFPTLITTFVTHEGVLDKLFNGADLMVPGVIMAPNSSDLVNRVMNIQKGEPAGICTRKNFACVAVGQSAVSGKEITEGIRSGKAVIILHTFNDELSKLLDDVPRLPVIDFIDPSGDKRSRSPPFDPDDLPEMQDDPSFPREPERLLPTQNEIVAAEEAFAQQNALAEQTPAEQIQSQEKSECLAEQLTEKASIGPTMDEIAEYCLLKALLSKKLELPILTNIFYAKFMCTVVPEGLELNIKKTKHKKLSNMLKSMQGEGLLGVEDNKGVQTLVSVNHGHLMFKQMRSKFEELENIPSNAPATSDPPGSSTVEIPVEIREDLVINKLVSPLFAKSTYQKGDSLTIEKARDAITVYVKQNNLVQAQNVTLDPILADVISTRQLTMPWSELMNKTIEKMGKCYFIKTSKDRVFSGKGKLPLIEVTTATRSGNKSVTMVNGMDKYGININDFARHCQHTLAASTTVNSTPTGMQFQVQGSQKPYICGLLVEKYNIPKRLIQGYAEKSKGKPSNNKKKPTK